jgi:plasmid stabilization system protein ParE
LARVELSRVALEDIARLEATHSLPRDTRGRIARSIGPLADFPRLGRLVETGRWKGFRFLLGPWRWMIVLYDYYEDEDRVVIATVQDGRASTAPVR